MPELLAVTVIGHDRPGIIADTTAALARLGGNLEDSTMTLLRGHFAMMLVVTVPADAGAVEAALAPLTDEGLVVTVRAVPPEPDPTHAGTTPFVLTVHGADRAGIVAAVTRVVAAAGGNITDLTTRLAGELYLLVAEVDLPDGTDVEALRSRLAATAAGLGVDVVLRPADADLL